jgi:hypothetical protein
LGAWLSHKNELEIAGASSDEIFRRFSDNLGCRTLPEPVTSAILVIVRPEGLGVKE